MPPWREASFPRLGKGWKAPFASCRGAHESSASRRRCTQMSAAISHIALHPEHQSARDVLATLTYEVVLMRRRTRQWVTTKWCGDGEAEAVELCCVLFDRFVTPKLADATRGRRGPARGRKPPRLRLTRARVKRARPRVPIRVRVRSSRRPPTRPTNPRASLSPACGPERTPGRGSGREPVRVRALESAALSSYWAGVASGRRGGSRRRRRSFCSTASANRNLRRNSTVPASSGVARRPRA